MTNSCEYEYMEYVNEDAIDPNLICSICQKPFRDPVSTPCDHTYGRTCITQWLTQSKNLSCPTCVQKPLTTKNLVQASRPLRNMLDKLRVQCILCKRKDIERGNFLDHISKSCLKATVACQAEDIKCPWKGLREELDEHISKCIFEPLRPILSVLIEDNRQLTDQVKKHSNQIKTLTKQLAQLNKTTTPGAAATATVESDGESDDSTTSEFTADGNATKEGHAIYIRNLPCSIKFNEVFQFFSNVGRIHYDTKRKKVGIFIFKAVNQNTGFCTAKVTYTNKESAMAAVAEYDKKTVPQWNTCLSVSIFETRKKQAKTDGTESKATGNQDKTDQSRTETDSDPKKKTRQRYPNSRPSGKPTN